jgi:DNA-binding transcriptional LysR family regulator
VAGAPFIGLHRGSDLRTVTDEYCLKAGFLPNVVLESDSPAIVRDLIALGVGLAFIPKISWSGMDYGPNVSLVNIKDPHCVRYVYMTWRENWYVSKASKLFQKHLIDFFEEKQT